MENFKRIYDEELEKHKEYDNTLWDILNHQAIRAFVYEICKRVHGEGEKGEEHAATYRIMEQIGKEQPSPTPTSEDRHIQLEALITERCGMVAENMQRQACGQSMAYSDKDFNEVANYGSAPGLPPRGRR